jgi:hypothetical protein
MNSSAPEIQPKKGFGTNSLVKLFVVIFTIVLPAVLVVAGVFLFGETNLKKSEEQPEEVVKSGVLKPSEVLADKEKYKDERIIIRGKVTQEPMVCERGNCPKEDPCCGCEEYRDLVIGDADEVFVEKTTGRLRILGFGASSFCQRTVGSCQYDCPDWNPGSIYELKGVFFAKPPPAKVTKLYFDFYFQVEEKQLVRTFGFYDKLDQIFGGIGEFFNSIFKSRYYVLD